MGASTIKQEVEVGRHNTPDVAWPTLRLAAGVYVGLAASIYGVISGAIPMVAGAIINTVILYSTYTVLHEAVHGNIIRRNPKWHWINKAAGMAIAAVLWMFFYPHKKSHMTHHAKCNTDADPDIYARGPFGVVTFWHIPLATLSNLNPLTLYKTCVHFNLTDRERRISLATYGAYAMVPTALIYLGYGYEFVMLWLIPYFIGYSIMLIFFTWVPHHDHMETGRYRDTRASLWLGAEFLTQGQNLHLIHHMMPTIPYYLYEATFKEIRPLLEQNHARIDGFWPSLKS